jgi:hypothetical protein
VIDGGLGQLHPPCKLRQVQIRVSAAPSGHLAKGRR